MYVALLAMKYSQIEVDNVSLSYLNIRNAICCITTFKNNTIRRSLNKCSVFAKYGANNKK